VFTYAVERKPTDTAAYPITLVSYHIACTSYKDPKTAQAVKGFESYVISPEGQQAAAKNAGSAPMTDAVRKQIQPAVDAIGAGSGGQ
jgi:phosphate transport system substrate-binding protein